MANEAVLKYLRNTNRPYSANDIVMNLHKEFGKTIVQRALDALVQQTVVLEKVYGKQKVYVIRQEAGGEVKEEEEQGKKNEYLLITVWCINVTPKKVKRMWLLF